jgi:hypothetical protein
MEYYTGNVGKSANDYFFIIDKKGAKIYYNKLNNKRLAKKDINIKYVEDVKEGSKYLNFEEYEQLLLKKKQFEDKILHFENKIKEIRELVANFDDMLGKKYDKNFEENYHKYIEQKSNRIDFLEKEREEAFKKFFSQNNKYAEYFKTNVQNNAEAGNILNSLDINSKKEWKDWLLKNHPDKGGNSEQCAKVICAGRAKGY